MSLSDRETEINNFHRIPEFLVKFKKQKHSFLIIGKTVMPKIIKLILGFFNSKRQFGIHKIVMLLD